MATVVYNKAVRDLIPTIIRRAGKECSVEKVDDATFLSLLNDKLLEEVSEYQAKPSLTELADVLETLMAILRLSGHTWEELEQERQQKAQQRGAFVENLVLREVKD